MTRLGKGRIGFSDSNRAEYDGHELNRSKIDNGKIDSKEVGDDEVEKKVQKSSKSKNLFM